MINITHKNCMDGLFSSMVVKHYCNNKGIELEVIPMQYGDELPELKDQFVIMTDFSFKREVIENLYKNNKDLTVIDHHKTAEKELDGLDYCKFDMNHSGAVLTWKELFPNDIIPEILLYIEDRDIWKWKLPDSQEFSAGIGLLNIDYFETGMLFNKNIIKNAIENGRVILNYQNTLIDKKVEHIDDNNYITINGEQIVCINNNNLISEIGNELSKSQPEDCSLQYFITEKDIVFSLRSIGDKDVSSIAKTFGGGGHKNAAGFTISLNDLKYEKFFIGKELDSYEYAEYKG